MRVSTKAQSNRTGSYIFKIACTVKNRLHSRQQPCRSPRQTVIGIGLRKFFFQKNSLAIPYSTALQKMSIFENAVLVCESAHVYTQVCLANLQLNGTRYFSVPFKLGQSGSAAVPLPRVPPFLCNHTLPFRIYISAAVTLPLQFKRLRLQLEYTKMTHAMMW